jgi:prevent-host-death family protein
MTMTEERRAVRIAELKARLSEHLRYVREGHMLTILDRNTPIATVVPHEPSGALRVREPENRLEVGEVPLPPPLPLDIDVLDLLMEDRQRDR